ncbi:bleomycin resistance protein [Fluviicola taffensis]|uniref:Bleomycin resistance protein n=1 Tax=Fluviicola taffensis (strain DSM 16823 / NCIMB 13979 / RW262) TaxID=755732 RepID=F2IF35_FLUTR|nr:VOC family protein [Fluviicola taffensis]AEA43509.1 lactoylglutathione lyase [Fluviicola taffensis DSM 16823]
MAISVPKKLPMRDKHATRQFYLNALGFHLFGHADFDGYLMVEKEDLQIHFFEQKELDSSEKHEQVHIRTNNIDAIYKELLHRKIAIHPNGHLATKPWGFREFSLFDPNNNLLIFSQSI